MIFKNSYVAGLSRLDCPNCYGDNKTVCRNLHGVRLLSISQLGNKFPLFQFTGSSFDVICNA